MLYPLKFKPRFLEKIWGGRRMETILGKALPPDLPIGESWEVYDFPPGVVDDSADWVSSEIANGPLVGRTLHSVIEEFGRAVHGDVPLLGAHGQFPIFTKFLDALENLSIQVHPDPAYAAQHPEAHLKTEAWYIVDSDAGAKVYRGLKAGTTREQFEEAIRAGTVDRLINEVPVRAGHCIFLPSGMVHALGAGILAAEVQTPSDTTFRLFDFHRLDPATRKPRKLHVAEALECIDFEHRPEPQQPRSHVAGLLTTVSRLVTCEHFKLEKVRFTEGVEEAVPYDQPVVWIMLEGEAEVKVEGMREPVVFGKGETVLLPAEMRSPVIKTRTDCIWLEVTFPITPEVG